MQFNILEILSYAVVFITILTMVFGVIAYSFYKIREVRRKRRKDNQMTLKYQKEQFLYFEEKELL